MSTPRFPELTRAVERATKGLPKVTSKPMFGCDAFFADGKIFALVWKTGRIGLKLADADDLATLAALPGSAPWSPGPAAIKKWVLVSPELANDPRALASWAKKAHAQALATEKAKAKAKPASKPRAAARPSGRRRA